MTFSFASSDIPLATDVDEAANITQVYLAAFVNNSVSLNPSSLLKNVTVSQLDGTIVAAPGNAQINFTVSVVFDGSSTELPSAADND